MRFVWRKFAQLIVVVLAVTFLSYLMLSLLPGDLAQVKCGISCDQQSLERTREELGLNQPIPLRYVKWLGKAVTGDLGKSGTNQQPITEALQQRLPTTIKLLVFSQLIALAIAVPAAVIAAQRAGGIFDRISTTLAFAGLSAPAYVVAPVLVYLFAVRLKWFPATGTEGLKSFVLPSVTLALAEMAAYLRLLRSDLISTLQEDYITMAKAKGLSPREVMIKHAFRPSTFSLVTVMGLNAGRLLGGTLIIEVIFALNGIGSYIVQGIFSRDYFAVQAGVVVVAVGYVLINFAVDMLYAALDPRIRHARAIA
ncbi:MAG: ABC transporter permease [Acidimicrobiales bacterium]|nr:ABC transporter permease [Acidimicrobiales bacterium]